jgi:hypothetical protein
MNIIEVSLLGILLTLSVSAAYLLFLIMKDDE